jgi:DegV family protein with EDD domain
MKKIKIITDTASDITIEKAKEKDIHLIPINISINGVNYKDRYDIDCETFNKMLSQSNEIPKTSQITVSEHYEEFKKFSDEYSIIYCCISAESSGTIQSANMAKQMILEENPEAEIYILECHTFSYCYGYWMIKAAEMAKQGYSVQEIIDMFEVNSSNTEAIFVVDDLTYLEKGGRIKPATKIVGNLLDIKPILSIEDGLITSIDKVRGSKKVNKKLLEILTNNISNDYDQNVLIFHIDALDRANQLKQLLTENTDYKNTIIVEVGPTISVHAGPGTLGYGYLKK